jgi:hypothetical protein
LISHREAEQVHKEKPRKNFWKDSLIFMDNEIEFKKTKHYQKYYEPRLEAVKELIEPEEYKKFQSKSFFQRLTAVDLFEKKRLFRGMRT